MRYGYLSECDGGLIPNIGWVVHFKCALANNEQRIYPNSGSTLCEGHFHVDNVHFQVVDFENCDFPKFHKHFIQIYKNMVKFNFSNVALEVLQPEFFNYTTTAKTIIVSQNKIEELPPQLFGNAMNLRVLDFAQNKIQSVDPLAFSQLYAVEYLNLSYNQISEISLKHANLTTLLSLDLSNNKLNSFEEHIFENVSALKSLNLSCNPIENLRVDIFTYLPNLENLSLRRIKISSIALGTFSYQDKLVSLDLSENALQYLDSGHFLPILRDLRSLRLNDNELTDLNEFRNALFPSLIELDIKNNRFNCENLKHFMNSFDCSKIDLIINPKSTNLQKSSIRGINCDNTEKVVNLPIEQILNNLSEKVNKINNFMIGIYFLLKDSKETKMLNNRVNITTDDYLQKFPFTFSIEFVFFSTKIINLMNQL